jgi:hypothetical protein
MNHMIEVLIDYVIGHQKENRHQTKPYPKKKKIVLTELLMYPEQSGADYQSTLVFLQELVTLAIMIFEHEHW